MVLRTLLGGFGAMPTLVVGMKILGGFGAMPTLVVGMKILGGFGAMPTTSWGMTPSQTPDFFALNVLLPPSAMTWLTGQIL